MEDIKKYKVMYRVQEIYDKQFSEEHDNCTNNIEKTSKMIISILNR